MAVLLLKAYSYSDTMTAAIYFYYVLNSTTTYSSVYYTGHGSVPTFTPKSRRSRFQWVGRAFEGNGGGHVIERYVRPVYAKDAQLERYPHESTIARTFEVLLTNIKLYIFSGVPENTAVNADSE